jgi:hypothetical protein
MKIVIENSLSKDANARNISANQIVRTNGI